MSSTPRILHLEDDPAATLLIRDMLRDAGMKATVTVVTGRADFQAALARDAFDIILADYNLPAFDGTAALEMSRAKRPEIPFIFVTGALGEERAVTLLKSGATDYVLKDRLWRLAPAIERALAESGEHARRKRAEEALRESEDRFRVFMERSPLFAWIKDAHFRLRYVNGAFAEAFQSTPEKLVGRTDFDFLPHEIAGQMRVNDQEVLATGKVIETIEEVRAADGSVRHWLVQKFPLVRSAETVWVGGTAVDVTARLEAEEAMKASLREKEVLLNEVHHRVKNNLQIVSSLLNLQSRQVTDPALIEVFAGTRDRVRAMAAVHEQLCGSGDFARIDLAAHLTELLRLLTRAHAAEGLHILPALRLDPIPVDLNTAVPLSLIANEAIINALKYAFVGRGEGTLTIELRSTAGHHELRIADDGPGLPPGVDPKKTRTLGLRLVRDLTRQIHGELHFESSASGTGIVVRWPPQPQ